MSKIVTISREYGAGGREIAQRVAEELGVELYDKAILRETAKASGFDMDLIRSEEEQIGRGESIFESICQVSSGFYQDTHKAIRDVQQAIILNFAKQGPCVILGRCADEILRQAGVDSLNVFIHADEVHRAVRISSYIHSTDATAIKKAMERTDRSRRTYYSRYTGKRWGDIRNYHLTLDSGALGQDLCVKFIIEAAQAQA